MLVGGLQRGDMEATVPLADRAGGGAKRATYGQIQVYCKSHYGFIPQTCWIADVLAELGLTSRQAPNRRNPDRPTKPCPSERRTAIIEAIARAERKLPQGEAQGARRQRLAPESD
jgi:hypothetical protein